MSSYRIEKVNELIKRELGQIIFREFEAPDGSLITVVKVETTRDLLETKVWLSIFPIIVAAEIFKNLKKKKDYFRFLLKQRHCINPMPRAKFVLDLNMGDFKRVENILSKIKDE
jgi:ribosome-binding factor A